MKLKYFIGAIAAATSLAALATGDKINFLEKGFPTHVEKVSEIEHIEYLSKQAGIKGFSHIAVINKDGSRTEINLDRLSDMVYVPYRGDNPLKISVTPHYTSATLQIDAPAGTFYRMNGYPEKNLDGLEQSAWAEYLIEDDIQWIQDVCDSNGTSLNKLKTSDVFETGGGQRDWFPSEIISDDTPIVICVYTGVISGGKINVTSEPILLEFTTKKLVDLGVEFDMSAEFNSTSMTIKADQPKGVLDEDIPFAIMLFSEAEYTTTSMSELIMNVVLNWENAIYTRGGSWDDYTYRGHGEKTFRNMRMGDKWLAVAIGLEYGVPNTGGTHLFIEIPEPEILSDCTFELSSTQKSPAQCDITVKPSKDTTKWVAFLEDSETVAAIGAKQVIANKVYFYNSTGQIYWAISDYVHSGEAVLDSHDDLIGGVYLEAGKEYDVLVCGIAQDGGRITEISDLKLKTDASANKKMTFGIKFGEFDGTDKWSHTQEWTIFPSDPEMTYVVADLKSTQVNIDVSDEQFITNYLDVQGQYLTLNQGEMTKKTYFGSEYNFDTGEWDLFHNRYLGIFGYNGAVTSELYLFEIDAYTGDIKQLRGPESDVPLRDLGFKIRISDFMADSNKSSFNWNIEPTTNESYRVYFADESSDFDFAGKTDEEVSDAYDLTLNFSADCSGATEGTENINAVSGSIKNKIMFVYGFADGEITTKLYAIRIDCNTGAAEVVCGPKSALDTSVVVPDPVPAEGDDFALAVYGWKSNDYVCSAKFKIVPADENMTYTSFCAYPGSDLAEYALEDPDFIHSLINDGFTFPERKGKYQHTIDFLQEYDEMIGELVFKTEIMIIAGMDEDFNVTTPVHAYEIDPVNQRFIRIK